MSSKVAVVGYASMDHSMECDEFRAAAGTTLIKRRLSDPWPGIGGIAHTARGLAAAGHQVHAVTWVGSDEPGKEYIDRLASYGVNVTGVCTDSARTPSCFLFYGPDGETVVVYDPGDRTAGNLTERQREIVADCDWVCLMVGPRTANLEVLDMLRDDQQLAWGVKGDPDAYSPESCTGSFPGPAWSVSAPANACSSTGSWLRGRSWNARARTRCSPRPTVPRVSGSGVATCTTWCRAPRSTPWTRPAQVTCSSPA
ncbi:hypothetical protein GCM10029964_021830 [Kibdelosporangium lantanae]